MDRECNEALLGIFFGRLGVEVEEPLKDDCTLSPNAHLWALQLKVGLQSLKDIEFGREFIQARQGNMSKLVMDEECRTSFATLILENSACAHCTTQNVLFGSLHICVTTQERESPIILLIVLSSQREHPMSILIDHEERIDQPHGESTWFL